MTDYNKRVSVSHSKPGFPADGPQIYDRLQQGSQLAECCFTSTETVGLLGTGAQDVHLDFHTAPELRCLDIQSECL